MFRTCLLIIVFSLTFYYGIRAQVSPHIEPPFWWTNMPANELLIILHEEGIGEWNPSVREKSVRLNEVLPCANPNYLLLKLHWDAVFKQSTIIIRLEKEGLIREVPYVFRNRDRTFKPMGLTPADAIYRITTDRFANGDPGNDRILSDNVNRKDPLARHGGDLQGVMAHTDHIRSLGMTAVQLDPVQKNEATDRSFSGQTITSHFEVDPRLGDSTIYRQLIGKLHRQELKIIQEMIYPWVSEQHHFVQDPPFPSWKESGQTGSFREETGRYSWRINDPVLTTYLTQMSMWWMEAYHPDALCIPACSQIDPSFVEQLTEQLAKAYPGVTVFGEAMSDAGSAERSQVGASGRALCPISIHGNLLFHQAIDELFSREGEKHSGVEGLYNWMVENEKQKNPDGSILFVDNAHLPRYFNRRDKKLEKWKMGLAVLATVKGTPSIYSGTEILVNQSRKNTSIRQDFPGGWNRDRKDKFTKEGRKKNEEEAFRYLQRLMTWRSKSQAIIRGTMVAYPPQKSVFAYFRRYGEQLVMVIINTGETDGSAQLDPWMDTLRGYTVSRDIFSGKEYPLTGSWSMKGLECRVLELER